ncbi:transcriptional activator protein CopR, partial [Vibrio parahaemolyticus V-223/04]
ANITCGRFRT